jgi:hypothetical protein
MADQTFDALLDQLFGETPAFGDADRFARRVVERLDRGWTARRLLIGGLGLLGGVIGGAQVLGSGLIGRIGDLTARSDRAISSSLAGMLPAGLTPRDMPLNGEILWMAAALAIVAVGFAITRAIREI